MKLDCSWYKKIWVQKGSWYKGDIIKIFWCTSLLPQVVLISSIKPISSKYLLNGKKYSVDLINSFGGELQLLIIVI